MQWFYEEKIDVEHTLQLYNKKCIKIDLKLWNVTIHNKIIIFMKLLISTLWLEVFNFNLLRAILQESEAKLEMKIFNPPSFFVWR